MIGKWQAQTSELFEEAKREARSGDPKLAKILSDRGYQEAFNHLQEQQELLSRLQSQFNELEGKVSDINEIQYLYDHYNELTEAISKQKSYLFSVEKYEFDLADAVLKELDPHLEGL